MPKIISNNISLYYQITGKGDHSVILISGANGDHQSVWPPQVVRIASEITSYSCAITEHPIMGVAL